MHFDLPIRGVSPVLAVPFHDDGSVDLVGFASVVDHVLAAGVTSCLMFGLASEFYKLADDERDRLLDVLMNRAAGESRFTAIGSVTDHATVLATATARRYVDRGVGAINVLPPHFLGPSRTAILDHLDAVLDAVEVPVIIQYAPRQTGTSLDPDDLVALAGVHRNLVAVKVESDPPGPIVERIATGGIAALVGQAGVHLPSADAAGAIGVQPGCSMVPLYQAMWNAADNGDVAGLGTAHAELLPVIAHWMTSVETIVKAEKSVLHRRGIIGSDHCRAPSPSLDPYARALVDHVVMLLDRYAKVGATEPGRQ